MSLSTWEMGTHTGRQGWCRSRQVTTQSVTEDNMSQEEFEGGKNRLWHMRNFYVQFFFWLTISFEHLAEQLVRHYA